MKNNFRDSDKDGKLGISELATYAVSVYSNGFKEADQEKVDDAEDAYMKVVDSNNNKFISKVNRIRYLEFLNF